jgi:L-iditol 2-dehydrogenase
MRAQVFYEPEKMALEEVPEPKAGAEEVVVRVKACGICGSDVAYYFGASSLETESGKGPLILGHEFTGEVVEVGTIPKSKGLFSVGDRVVLDPVQYCNACEICKRAHPNLCENKTVLGVSVNGGFAEYCASHYTGVHKLPEQVSYEAGALTEPIACATYGVQNLNVSPGQFAVVYGAGPIGLTMVQLIKASGAGTVVLVETEDYRLKLGERLGADVCLNPAAKQSPYYCADVVATIKDLTQGKMADRAICATSALPAMEQALAVTGRASTIVYFGLPGDKDRLSLPVLDCILWDKTIRFSWLAPNTWPTALSTLASGAVKAEPMISGRHDLADLIPAITNVRDKQGEPMKELVVP